MLYDAVEMIDETPPGAPLLSSDFQFNFNEEYQKDAAKAARLLLEGFSVEALDKADQYRRWVGYALSAYPLRLTTHATVGCASTRRRSEEDHRRAGIRDPTSVIHDRRKVHRKVQ
jgi:hypothetical protein